MKAALALLVAPLLAGCVIGGVVPVPVGSQERAREGQTIGESAFAGPWDSIAFDTESWGRPVSAWQVQRDRSGTWRQAARAGGEMTVQPLALDAATHARLTALIASLPYPAPTSEGCGNFLTDQPYGALRLRRGASTLEIAYNSGCRDATYARFLATLREADELVAQAAGRSPAP